MQRQTSLLVYRAAGCWTERKVERERNKHGEREKQTQTVRERCRGTETDRPTCLLSSRLLEREKGGETETNTACQRQRYRDRQAHLFTEQQVVGCGETLVVDGERYDWFSETLQEQQKGLGH